MTLSNIENSKAPSLWRKADFMLLWGGQVISTLGTESSSIVYPLLTLALTNSPAAAGIAGIGGMIGSLIGGQATTTIIWGMTLLFTRVARVPHFFFLGAISALCWMLIAVYNMAGIRQRLALIPEVLQGRVNSVFRFLAFAFKPWAWPCRVYCSSALA